MISKTYYRYIWLLNTLLDSDPLPYEIIAMLWEQNHICDGDLPLRTFHEHRKGIKELFGVDIVCNKSNGYTYYVKNPEVLNQNKLAKWMLKAYNVPEDFVTYHRMKDRVLLEEMSRGHVFVDLILDALQRDVIVEIDYQSYDGPNELLHVSPYALKAYNRQWYILGYITEKNAIRHLALNRTLRIKVTNKSFVRPIDFDARKFYANTIGIFNNDDIPIETIKIRAYGIQGEYIRSLPIHKSQEEVKTKHGEYADFTYRLCITPELISTLLSMGDKVEVMEPLSLREQISKQLTAAVERYKPTKE